MLVNQMALNFCLLASKVGQPLLLHFSVESWSSNKEH
jgi:hypothetical protein